MKLFHHVQHMRKFAKIQGYPGSLYTKIYHSPINTNKSFPAHYMHTLTTLKLDYQVVGHAQKKKLELMLVLQSKGHCHYGLARGQRTFINESQLFKTIILLEKLMIKIIFASLFH